MKLKISNDNAAALTELLEQINKRAATHTALAIDIIRAADEAEAGLAKLGLPKAERKGASVFFRSGYRVKHAYQYGRTVNHATLVRGSSGWFLTELTKDEVQPSAKPTLLTTLTREQDATVVEKLRENYFIAQPVAHPVQQEVAS